MNRIEKLFNDKKKNILSVFYTAGYPELDSTKEIAKRLEEAGVNMMEIGIPFSDPIADGATIQESNKVALENGMTVKLLLEQVKEIRKEVTMPVILMGYLNPVLQYGFDRFCKDAAANGADGLILPDMPLDEFELNYKESIESSGLCISFLISPTTSIDRIRKVEELSSGFIYAVSSSSTTGVKSEFIQEQEHYFKRLQDMNLKKSFLIGFGVSSKSTFSKACEYSSGAIIGSAFIKSLKENTDFNFIPSFISSIRQ